MQNLEHKKQVLKGLLILLKNELEDEMRCFGDISLTTQKEIIEAMQFVNQDMFELTTPKSASKSHSNV